MQYDTEEQSTYNNINEAIRKVYKEASTNSPSRYGLIKDFAELAGSILHTQQHTSPIEVSKVWTNGEKAFFEAHHRGTKYIVSIKIG